MAETNFTLHPKDKGWAWMILISAFVVEAVNIGFLRSFGLLFVAIQKQYGYSSSVVSAVLGASNLGMCIFNAIAMNVFVKKWNVRSVCIVGTLCETVGVCLGTLVPNPVFLMLCLGLLQGIGQGMLVLPARYMVSMYFQKRHSIAIFISSCGSSVGGILFPIATKAFLDSYGLQGAMLMISGITLNQLLFVITFTPPSDYGYSEKDNVNSDNNENQMLRRQRLLSSGATSPAGESELEMNFQNDSEFSIAEHKASSLQPNVPARQGLGENTVDCLTIERQGLVHKDPLLLSPSTNGEHNKGVTHGPDNKCKRLPPSTDSSPKVSNCRLSLPDVMYSKLFWVLLPFCFGCPAGTSIAFVFIPPLAVEKGLGRDVGAYFLTIASITDIVGKLVTGVILQMGLLKPSLWPILPQLIGCVLYSCVFLFNDYTSMLILTIVYGTTGGYFYGCLPLLIIEVLGMPLLASATGLYGAVFALALAVSYPIAGSLQDLTGTYKTTFVFLAAMLLIGILSLVAVNVLKPKEGVRRDNTSSKTRSTSL